jgi:hydroxymethylbilane synthase
VRALLLAAHGLDESAVALSPITTSGDRIKDKPLRSFGGKGLFTKEIDEALIAGEIDLAVHSMKDLPTALPDGTAIAAVLQRGDVRDAFISATGKTLAELPAAARIGSSSLRRQAQLRRLRPDLDLVDLRGNVETRLAKIERGVADATLLALAGLDRLGLTAHVTAVMPTEEMLPAVAQGAIGIAARSDEERLSALLASLNDERTAQAVACERSFLAELDGSCKTPIAGLAEIEDGQLRFRGLILRPDGGEWYEVAARGPVADAVSLGRDAGRDLIARAGRDFVASLA